MKFCDGFAISLCRMGVTSKTQGQLIKIEKYYQKNLKR